MAKKEGLGIALAVCGIFALCSAVGYLYVCIARLYSEAEVSAELHARRTTGIIAAGLESSFAKSGRYPSCDLKTCPKMFPDWTPSPDEIIVYAQAGSDGQSYSLTVGVQKAVISTLFTHDVEMLCKLDETASSRNVQAKTPLCTQSESTTCDNSITCALLEVYVSIFFP